jgi:hypothetical protein
MNFIRRLLAWLKRFFIWLAEQEIEDDHATRIAVIDDSGIEQGEGQMGKPLVNTMKRPLTLVPRGKSGKDLRDKIQKGTMVAVSADESVATIALDPADEFLAWISPVDDALSDEAKFSFKADANPNADITDDITGVYSCPIISEAASIIDPAEGEDVPK